MLIDIFFDVLEILGFLTLFLVIGALIMALSGPLGIIRTAISNSDQALGGIEHDLVLVPGFEPGSPPRKGGMMDRTTPHERWTSVPCFRFNGFAFLLPWDALDFAST